jgi:1-deoxy-D-xylulose-5-phosphate synthase
MVVSAPMDEQDLRNLMFTASTHQDGAFAIRYPRGSGTGMVLSAFEKIEIGNGRILQSGHDVAILSYGSIGIQASKAVAELANDDFVITHADMRFVKPLDTELIDQLIKTHHSIITVEDGTRVGGFGSAVAEYVLSKGWGGKLTILGVPDGIMEHGSQAELWRDAGIDASSIHRQALQYLQDRTLAHS